MSVTMSEKRKPGRPRKPATPATEGESERKPINWRPPADVWEALNDHLAKVEASTGLRQNRSAVYEAALRMWLRRNGYPLSDSGPSDD